MPSSTPPESPSPPPALSVDRIEGDRAILDAGPHGMIEVPAALLPAGAGEGSVLCLALLPEARQAALSDAEARLARLKARSPAKKIIDL